MKTIALIIVLQFIVTILTGCSEFPIGAKLEEMRQLECRPVDSSGCAGFQK